LPRTSPAHPLVARKPVAVSQRPCAAPKCHHFPVTTSPYASWSRSTNRRLPVAPALAEALLPVLDSKAASAGHLVFSHDVSLGSSAVLQGDGRALKKHRDLLQDVRSSPDLASHFVDLAQDTIARNLDHGGVHRKIHQPVLRLGALDAQKASASQELVVRLTPAQGAIGKKKQTRLAHWALVQLANVGDRRNPKAGSQSR